MPAIATSGIFDCSDFGFFSMFSLARREFLPSFPNEKAFQMSRRGKKKICIPVAFPSRPPDPDSVSLHYRLRSIPQTIRTSGIPISPVKILNILKFLYHMWGILLWGIIQ